MKFLSKLLLSAAIVTFATGYAAAKDKKISVGVISGNEYEVFATAAKVAKEKYGVEVKLIKFDDYVLPNEALSQKKLDANAFQHVPYLDAQIKARGYKIVSVGKTFLWPIAAYSRTINSASQLQKGAKISIPNDPSNQGRALLLLQAQGLIKLKSKTELTQSIADIIDNPKSLKILPVDANLVYRTLNEVDLAIINNNFAAQNGLTAKDQVFIESHDSPYTNIVAAREDNQTDPDILDFVKAIHSQEVLDKANKEFNGQVIKGWDVNGK